MIGVTKKPCLCCHWLGELLRSSTEGRFVLPETHGLIFPWTPPLFGIPEPVLVTLQQKLVSKLTEVTTDWIARQPRPRRSKRRRSPDDIDMSSLFPQL